MLLNLGCEFPVSWAEGADGDYVVLGFAEAGGGDAFVLLVGERDALACGVLDLAGYGIVAHAEGEKLRRGAGKSAHGQLAFPRFADPTFFGNFLDVAGALSPGVGKMKRDPGPRGEQAHGQDDEQQQDQPEESPARRRLRRDCTVHAEESTCVAAVCRAWVVVQAKIKGKARETREKQEPASESGRYIRQSQEPTRKVGVWGAQRKAGPPP